MKQYFLGIDVSKGYADFMLLDSQKRVVEPNFQLDDTFEGHCKLYEFLEHFYSLHLNATLCAAVESTGGYEDNWFHSLHKFQQNFNLKVARLNPKGDLQIEILLILLLLIQRSLTHETILSWYRCQ